MKKNQQISVTGAALAITGIIMFSAKAIMVKLGYRYDADTLTLLLLRMLFALPFFLIIAYRSSRSRDGYQLSRKDFVHIFLLGFVGYYLSSYFDFYGLKFISASLERLILFIYPTFVILISVLFLKKKATKIQIIAISITYFGIFITFADELNVAGENVMKGVSFIFLCAITYATYLVGSGALIPKIGSVRFTAYAMTVSSVIVIIHNSISNSSEVLNQPWQVYALGFGMAMISTVIPSFLISEAIKRMGASNFAIYASLGPISTIILAIIFLGERLDIYQIAGTVIVIAGVSIINIKKK